jgi:microcystin-dependent protein
VASVTGTGYTRFPLGTAALPGLTPFGDPDTGHYSTGANKLAGATNGVKAYEIDASQNVALSAGLTVAGTLAVTGAITGPGSVPIGGTVIWWDDTLPTEGGWAWANGQIIASANTVAPVLLARWGSRFGGNGITTMGVPNLCEVAPIGKSTMGGAAARGLFAAAQTVLNAIFGVEKAAMLRSDLPDVAPTVSGSQTLVHTAQGAANPQTGNPSAGATAMATSPANAATYATTQFATLDNHTVNFSNAVVQSLNGGVTQTQQSKVQPSATCNYIVRLG